MPLVEWCKTKYQKRKVLYNLAGVMALTFAVATIAHGVVKRNCVPRLLDVVDRPGTESTNSFSFFFERFDEWFPPTSYGHGMVMTDGN